MRLLDKTSEASVYYVYSTSESWYFYYDELISLCPFSGGSNATKDTIVLVPRVGDE